MSLPFYSFDTNAFIDWWVRYYSPEILPSLKAHVETVVLEGRLKASMSVYGELEKNDDDVFKWTKGLKGSIFLEDSVDVQKAVRPLISKYSFPLQPRRGLGGADPFVIAHAQIASPQWVVVSGEKGDLNNPKMGYVCTQLGIECISFRQFWQKEGWTL